jgi:hypothetical protein
MEPIFVYLPSADSERLINLNQVVLIDGITDDNVSLHMSNGPIINIHGDEAVTKLVDLISEYAITLDGTPLRQALAALPRLGPTIVKKPESTE